MRLAIFGIIVFLFGNVILAKLEATLPKTSITLNAARGCRVHIAAWLSPSCTHCAEYFVSDLAKIVQMPGFCVDLHSLPHLYLLDMPVSVLIWSQGQDNAYKNAEIFYKNQDQWLGKSISRDKPDDSRRITDREDFFKEMASSKDLPKIKAYLDDSRDQYLYVKMFALRHFGVGHLEKYLPKGLPLDKDLSMALFNDLPSKNGKAINFSPAFTSASGQLLPDSQLDRGILTESAAANLLTMSGPIVPSATVPSPVAVPPAMVPKSKLAPPAKKVSRKENLVEDDAQDADSDSDADFNDADGLPEDEDAEADDSGIDPDSDADFYKDFHDEQELSDDEDGEADEDELLAMLN